MKRTFPPGPKGMPLIGSVTDFINRPIPFMTEAASYGDLAHFRMGPFHAYLVKSPEYVHEVLVKQADNFHRDPISRRAAIKFIGNGLIASEGDLHKTQRKLMQPAFHHKRLEGYADVMVGQAQKTIASWEGRSEINLDREMQALTLKLVCQSLLSADVSGQTDRVAEAMEDFQDVLAVETREIIPIPDWVPLQRKRRMRKSIDTLNSIIKGIISERRVSNIDHGDFLSMMMLAVNEDDGSGMTDQQVHDQAVTLLIAGHETTASVMTWALFLLSQYPEIEQKLYQELDNILAGRAPTLADLPNLPYLEKVIKETLRLYPSGWIFGRSPLNDLTLGQYQLMKGDILFLVPFVTHRDERYFPEPEAFKPERFTAEFEKQLPRSAYFPFSNGIHICMGQHFAMMEAKLVLATVLGQYQMRRANQEEILPVGLATLRPSASLPMRLKKRIPEIAQQSAN